MRRHVRIWCLYLTLVISLALAVALPSVMAGAASAPLHQSEKPSAKLCQAGWVYDHITVLGTPLERVGPAYQNINATNGPALSIFVEATSDTVVMTTSRVLTVSASVIVRSVAASTRKSVAQAITVTTGNFITYATPAHTIAYAEYGVYMVETRGHYYYRDLFCNTPSWLDQGEVTSRCPWYAGWHIWTVGSDSKSPSIKGNLAKKLPDLLKQAVSQQKR